MTDPIPPLRCAGRFFNHTQTCTIPLFPFTHKIGQIMDTYTFYIVRVMLGDQPLTFVSSKEQAIMDLLPLLYPAKSYSIALKYVVSFDAFSAAEALLMFKRTAKVSLTYVTEYKDGQLSDLIASKYTLNFYDYAD